MDLKGESTEMLEAYLKDANLELADWKLRHRRAEHSLEMAVKMIAYEQEASAAIEAELSSRKAEWWD